MKTLYDNNGKETKLVESSDISLWSNSTIVLSGTEPDMEMVKQGLYIVNVVSETIIGSITISRYCKGILVCVGTDSIMFLAKGGELYYCYYSNAVSVWTVTKL